MFRCFPCVLVLVVAAVLAAADSGRAGDKKKPASPEGTWVGTSWKRGPGEVPKDKVDTELVLTRTTYEFPRGINRISAKGAVKIDDVKGTIDFTPGDGPAKGKTLKGIYRVEGNVLTLCFTSAGGERPAEFKSGNRNTVLATYEKKK
ncbi:MAG: TIGR03067 domain-containing protein [Gemmataceae bacterium]|nr:TIGR03067 domain-containing protein [Gemmataceae bacterium]